MRVGASGGPWLLAGTGKTTSFPCAKENVFFKKSTKVNRAKMLFFSHHLYNPILCLKKKENPDSRWHLEQSYAKLRKINRQGPQHLRVLDSDTQRQRLQNRQTLPGLPSLPLSARNSAIPEGQCGQSHRLSDHFAPAVPTSQNALPHLFHFSNRNELLHTLQDPAGRWQLAAALWDTLFPSHRPRP